MRDEPYAVIDIGSNSLRLVIFKGPHRHPLKLLNDSLMCGLGQTNENGELTEPKMVHALETIHRYTKICQELQITNVYGLATAALRQAANRVDFIKRVYDATGLKICVMSGEEEAELAAQGVISAFPGSSGIVADLGGSSLEITRISGGESLGKISLPIGPLALASLDEKEQIVFINQQMKAAQPLFDKPVPALYLVGGSPRAIAKAHMEAKSYPIEIVHGYTLPAPEAAHAFQWIRGLPLADFDKASARVKRRKHLLPAATLPLSALMQAAKPDAVVFSAYGLREGFAYTRLNAQEKKKDILMTSCQTLAHLDPRFPASAESLAQWLQPILAHKGFFTPLHARLTLAAACLADCGWTVLPEYRPEFALKKILHSPSIMCAHQERLLLAIAIYHRYEGKRKNQALKHYTQLMSPADQAFAEALGFLLGFYANLFDNIPQTWELFPYEIHGNQMILQIAQGLIDSEHLTSFQKKFGKSLKMTLSFQGNKGEEKRQ